MKMKKADLKHVLLDILEQIRLSHTSARIVARRHEFHVKEMIEEL